MKTFTLISLSASLLVLSGLSGLAQAEIYRCGNEYTNKISESQKGQCKLVEGGNVTIVEGFKPPVATAARGAPASASPVRLASAAPPAARVDSAEQKSRDSDARLILEAELKKAEARFAELSREYNNGQPEKQGGESRNHQKYLDRVAEMKSDLSRTESDIAGIRRELGRVSASK